MSDIPELVVRAKELQVKTPNTVIQRTPSTRVLRAYQDYLDMGETRSLTALAEQYKEMERIHGKGSAPTTSAGTLSVWSSKWNWQLQIRIDTAQLNQQRREQRREVLKTVAERQTQSSRILQQIALKKLQHLIEKTGELTEEGKELSPAEARKMLLEGARLERVLMEGYAGSELDSEFDNEISYE